MMDINASVEALGDYEVVEAEPVGAYDYWVCNETHYGTRYIVVRDAFDS